ncbi:conserved hypothetical protein [Histoplasma capsulatum H143]|uniref:Uncharacterized protein n=1 Tax=Ajellomyces capsulatus (strain H143) TaxID=544712 RepID=C6HGU9_AJECH|nr:conserved hypothetical protein [Histoplasma capsulatum H143]
MARFGVLPERGGFRSSDVDPRAMVGSFGKLLSLKPHTNLINQRAAQPTREDERTKPHPRLHPSSVRKVGNQSASHNWMFSPFGQHTNSLFHGAFASDFVRLRASSEVIHFFFLFGYLD